MPASGTLHCDNFMLLFTKTMDLYEMKKSFFTGIFIFLFICLNPVFCNDTNYEKWNFKNIENSIPRGAYTKLNDGKILVTTSQENNYIYDK